MPTEPVPPDPERDDDPARPAGEPDPPSPAGPAGEVPQGWRQLPPSRQDWLTRDEWTAWLDSA